MSKESDPKRIVATSPDARAPRATVDKGMTAMEPPSISDGSAMILLTIDLVLLVCGMMVDIAALVLIATPILLPVAEGLGLGLCTPPVGSCLFVGCAVGKLPIEKAVRTIWPFYLAILVALMLITFVPAISLTLPRLLGM